MAGDDDFDETSLGPDTCVAKDLEEKKSGDDLVLELRNSIKGETSDVSRKAKRSLEIAMEACLSQPNYYYKCDYVVNAVCDIMGTTKVTHLFPETSEDTTEEEVDWTAVIADGKETYPKPFELPPEAFAEVRCVYNHVKNDKDREAQERGMPKSGVQSYKTFQHKWYDFRWWVTLYKLMNPTMSPQTVLNLVKVELSGLPSNDKIWDHIQTVIKKHKANIVRLERLKRQKEEAAQELINLAAQQQEAENQLAQAESQAKKLAETRSRALTRSTRSGAAGKKDTLRKVCEKEKEVKLQKRLASKLKRQSCKKIKQVEKRKKVLESADKAPKKAQKQAPRNDLTLVNAAVTPRQLCDRDGDAWKPPTLNQNDEFDEPGEKWKEASREKLELLFTLYKHLKDAEEIEAPLTFSAVMEFIGADVGNTKLDFYDRVFIHLVALILHQSFHFGDVVAMLLSLLEKNLMTAATMVNATVDELVDALEGDEGSGYDFNPLATQLLGIASHVVANEGLVPTDFEEMVEAGVDEVVAQLMMQQVFGSTELIIRLNHIVVVCALDLFDWEQLGVELKTEIDVKSISAEHVLSSAATWLPRGKGIKFQQALEALGAIIGQNKKGFWGKLQAVITKYFKGKDKAKVEGLVNDILRFYKICKCGAVKKLRF